MPVEKASVRCLDATQISVAQQANVDSDEQLSRTHDAPCTLALGCRSEAQGEAVNGVPLARTLRFSTIP
jgi:hypothetical protein